MKLHWALILILAIPVAAAAEEYAGEVTASLLRLRAGPSPDYQEVARLPRGARVVVVGRSANSAEWVKVTVPQGYAAWVYGKFVTEGKDGFGEIMVDRLLVRPTAATKYHHLDGHLQKGERVEILGRATSDEGPWLRIRVPGRVPLYAHSEYLRNIGDASLATPRVKEPAAETVLPEAVAGGDADRRFEALEPRLRAQLGRVVDPNDVEPLKRAVLAIDRASLNLDNRERRVKLMSDILDVERKTAVADLRAKETAVQSDLELKLKEIQERYEQRLREIENEANRGEKKSRFAASGVLAWRPDIVGRYPSFRLEEGKKLRYFLIAPNYDLKQFVGKRVGVTGLTDPESGTGYHTVIVDRIEIIADK